MDAYSGHNSEQCLLDFLYSFDIDIFRRPLHYKAITNIVILDLIHLVLLWNVVISKKERLLIFISINRSQRKSRLGENQFAKSAITHRASATKRTSNLHNRLTRTTTEVNFTISMLKSCFIDIEIVSMKEVSIFMSKTNYTWQM